MKKIFNLSLLLLSALCSRAQEAMSSNTNLQHTFTSDKLTSSELDAFEKRAVQKLEDFYNYLEVISNPGYDKTLREEAKKQALELFSGNECRVDGIKVGTLLDSCINITQETKSFNVEDARVKEKFPLQAGVAGYSGSMEFRLSSASSSSAAKQASILLIKTEKIFGTEKKQVWTVFLCEIK